MKLYEIASGLNIIEKMLDYDMNDTEEEELLKAYNKLEVSLEEKADAISIINKAMDDDVSKIDAEIKRLQARKKAIKNSQKRLKENVMYNMLAMGLTKIKTALHTLSIRNNAASLVVDENVPAESFPEHYLRVKYEIDKKAIMDDYKITGILPEGCKVSRSKSLQVR